MQIKNMHKVNIPDSKIRAFFSVETKNFIINDVKLIESEKGLFAAMPSKEYLDKKTNQKKYSPIIWIKDLDIIKTISEEAAKVYNGNSKLDSDDIPF